MTLAVPLVACGLSRTFDAAGSRFTLAVDEMRVPAGARVAITGPSGCGKSTLLALLALALRPDEGQALVLAGTDALVLWNAGRLDALATLRAAAVGFVPQTGSLLPFLTLRANIVLPQAIQGRPEPGRVDALAERLGIAGVMSRKPAEVSVGQRQRAAIARALAHRPLVVLADEPTASVHPAQADEILALLTQAAERDGVALIIATHDLSRAQAAGYNLAPCRPEAGAELTRFGWVP